MEERFYSPRACACRVFFTCWLIYAFFWTHYIVREHFPAVALMEQGSLNVERYWGWSKDIFRGPKGGAYINNNPGASLAGAIPLLLLKPILNKVDKWNQKLPRRRTHRDGTELFERTLEEGRAFYFLLVAFLTVALVMAPATAATTGYMCLRLMQTGVERRSAVAVALFYGIGTPVLFRVGHLNHNLLVADAGITALLFLWDPKGAPLAAGRAAIAGLLAGCSLVFDYSGVVVIVVSAVYAWLRCRKQPTHQVWQIMGAYLLGVLPGTAGLMLYQTWAFGSPYRPSQHYMTPTSPTSQGYRGFDWPSPAIAWANFVDPRFGLFAYCPALILAFAAPFVKGASYRIPKRETYILLAYFAIFVVFCAANRYSLLQPLTGLRYLIPVVPALALLAAQTVAALRRFVRWTVMSVAVFESLVLAAAHENDIRQALQTLWARRFVPVWAIYLGRAGVPGTRAWALLAFVLIAITVTLIWVPPNVRPEAVVAAISHSSLEETT